MLGCIGWWEFGLNSAQHVSASAKEHKFGMCLESPPRCAVSWHTHCLESPMVVRFNSGFGMLPVTTGCGEAWLRHWNFHKWRSSTLYGAILDMTDFMESKRAVPG